MAGKSFAWIGALLLLVLAALGGLGWPGEGRAFFLRQDDPPANEDNKEDSKLAAGLQLTFESLAKGGVTDTRTARLVALHVPAGTPPTPFLPAGPFRATWHGELNLELKEAYTFSAQGRGSLQVLVNGTLAFEAKGDDFAKVAGKEATLKRGANKLQVRYESPTSGDAELRLYWGGEEFRPEPVTLKALRHDPTAPALQEGLRRRQGRDLLAQSRCLQCHKADTAGWVKGGGMPELEASAPSLDEVGARLQPEWMARWIQDPSALRPQATMPHLLPDAPRGLKAKLDPRAHDMAAYLATLGKADTKSEPPAKKEAVEEGTRLFAQLGCVGCHTAPGKDEYAEDEHGRLPLRDVAAKWKPKALRGFLRQPDRHYPWVRMPNFHFSADEVEQLVAYLLSPERRALVPSGLPTPNVDRGRQLVQALGCLNCHAVGTLKPSPEAAVAPPFAKLSSDGWDRGCMAAKPTAGQKAPLFSFKPEQSAALRAFVASGKESLTRDTAAEFAGRQLQALRCNACHKRDGQEDHWTQLKEEVDGLVAALPVVAEEKDKDKYPPIQVRPSLTWVGEKLKPEWTEAFLAGKVAEKPRPFLRARMPAFPRRAGMLARGLTFEHGYSARSEPDREPDPKLAEVGRNLASKMKWGCVSCHTVGNAEAVGVFEAPGPNFMFSKERLRRDYFDHWLWSPLRVEPETKMPSVYLWGKPSPLADVLDGDARKQVDAIWHFLQTGRKIKAPPES